MAQQIIDLGAVANDGTGDTLREGGDKINDNFTELYASLGTSAGLTLIDSFTFTGSESAKTFSSIPATFKDLVLIFNGRSQRAGQVASTHGVRFNSDSTAANYYSQFINASGTTINASNTSASVGYAAGLVYPAATASAGCAGYFEMKVGDYAGTTFHKMFSGEQMYSDAASAGGHSAKRFGGRWLSTSAITSVEFLDINTQNFVAGSKVELYGRG